MADDEIGPRSGEQYDVRPVPDPTKLTNEAVAKMASDLKELFNIQFATVLKEIARIDRALEGRPAEIATAVGHLEVLFTEKLHSLELNSAEQFKSVQTQFRERDTRTEQSSKDSKVAVDAALQAAKEAVGEQNKSSALAIAKSEAATNKQLDQIGLVINATNNGMNDKIDDIKQRLAVVENRRYEPNALQQTPVPVVQTPSTNVMPYIMGGFGLFLLVVILIYEFTSRMPVGVGK